MVFMTRKILFRSSLVAVLALVFSLVFTTACRKNTECKATVTVIDRATGNVVPSVKVRLYANIAPKGQVEDIQTTDGSGKAYFNFKLQAIFDVEITGKTCDGGCIVKLEPGKNVEQTTYVK